MEFAVILLYRAIKIELTASREGEEGGSRWEKSESPQAFIVEVYTRKENRHPRSQKAKAREGSIK